MGREYFKVKVVHCEMYIGFPDEFIGSIQDAYRSKQTDNIFVRCEWNCDSDIEDEGFLCFPDSWVQILND